MYGYVQTRHGGRHARVDTQRPPCAGEQLASAASASLASTNETRGGGRLLMSRPRAATRTLTLNTRFITRSRLVSQRASFAPLPTLLR